MRRLDSITDSMDMSLSKLLEILKDRKAWRAAVHGVTKNWTQLTGIPLQYSCLENPMDGEAWLQSIGLQRVRHN